MISTPSTQTSRAYTSSQKFTLAEMDQQLGALMSDEPFWTVAATNLSADPFAVAHLCAEPFSVANVSLPSNYSSKMDVTSWDSSALQIDDVAV